MAVSIIQNYGSNNDPATAPYLGPLGALYNNRYTYSALQYPGDLGATYKGHIVKFDIYEVNPVTLSEIKDYVVDAYTDATGPELLSGNDESTSPWVDVNGLNVLEKDIPSKIGDQASEVWDKLINGELTNFKIDTSPRTNSSITDSISLYMPDTVDFSYTSNYTNLDLASIAAPIPLVGTITQALTSGSDGLGAAARLALNAGGYVFNPQQQLLFQGIHFRTYNMSFVFTPKSAQEAENIKEIIKAFRKAAAPRIVTGAAGFFYNPPSMVDVSFLFDGRKNQNLNYIKRSVIENIEVNYAPNGWAAHNDGAPVQTTLTMSFKEMSLVDKAAIEQGF